MENYIRKVLQFEQKKGYRIPRNSEQGWSLVVDETKQKIIVLGGVWLRTIFRSLRFIEQGPHTMQKASAKMGPI